MVKYQETLTDKEKIYEEVYGAIPCRCCEDCNVIIGMQMGEIENLKRQLVEKARHFKELDHYCKKIERKLQWMTKHYAHNAEKDTSQY